MIQTSYTFETQITKSVGLNYIVYLPPDYDDDPNHHFPMILFLHGGGERGDDIEKVKTSGIAQKLQNGFELSFVVVSPQCPKDSHWTLLIDDLNALIDKVISQYCVDEKRIYLTGLSLGGSGTWMMAGAYPERFAAVAPVCGRIVPLPLERLLNLPIWVFHGLDDHVVPVDEAQRTVNAITKMGGNIRFTAYPDVGHDAWKVTYDDPAFYDWLLSNRRT